MASKSDAIAKGAKCSECPLNEIGKFTPSIGPEQAKIAFVGEAPGRNEARQGKPFVGESGKLLDTVMKHYDIDREEVFLTNACLCRPPDNTTPAKAALNACKPRLVRELQDHAVETVVTLGNSAAESLLSKSGVTKLRVGPGRESSHLPGVRVIPTLHPAAALRQGDLFPYIVTDIGKVVKEPYVYTEPVYVVLETRLDALQAIRELAAREGPLVIDIEVDIEKDTAYDHPNHYGMLCVGIAYAPNRAVVFSEGVLGEREVLDGLGELLRSKRLIGQNGKFDAAGLYPTLGPLKLWFDTMLASYCFDERPGIHGLKFQAVEYLGAPQYDEEIKKYVGPRDGYGVIPRDILYRYNAYDVCCTYALWEMYERRFDQHPELRRLHDHLVAASNELMYVELNGISIDREYLRQLAREFLESLADIESEIDRIIEPSVALLGNYDKKGGLNPRSPLQVKKYLSDHGIRVDSTNEATLLVLLDKLKQRGEEEKEVAEFTRTLLKHRKEAKLYGTYVKGVQKRMYRGRVYPTFLLHGTTSGRLACRNPNLQNVPRGSSIRKLYVPGKCGCDRCAAGESRRVFVHTDGAQMELRVLTWLAKEPYFQQIFNEGVRDLFDELTPILYPGRTKENTSKEAWKELRIRVKAFVYGLSYGREAFSIAQEYRITEKEAATQMNRFFDVIPNIVEFRKEVKRKVFAGEDLITAFGRHRRYTLITKNNWKDIQKEALAFLPQSTASDICLSAMVKVRQDLKGIGWVRNIIHDAILAECHIEDAPLVSSIMEKRMIEASQQVVDGYVKFACESTVGNNWGEV